MDFDVEEDYVTRQIFSLYFRIIWRAKSEFQYNDL